ncbi:hypothetical protein QFC22_005268 [Naganishia vaughanmartiniae]|uniref:Uncharacterized protein n=1 Tax=Naganishia vaughanmartiniae TaxID=1424756 RepID=A0ACC2WUQ1_9TREE|nr:hypothetical protein QFC22_005268 [Naganishia vaughanmartiniae]
MPLHEEGKPDPQGLQLWIDLPAKDKGIDPLYQEMLSKDIITVHPAADVEITVISGESHGEKGPVRPVGGCWYLDFKLKKKGAKVFQPLPKGWTSFIYLLSGGLRIGDDAAEQSAYHTIVLSANEREDGVWLESTEDGLTRGVLIAGEPLQQRVVQYGPFVTTSTEEARQAIQDFQNAENGFEKAKHWRSEIGATSGDSNTHLSQPNSYPSSAMDALDLEGGPAIPAIANFADFCALCAGAVNGCQSVSPIFAYSLPKHANSFNMTFSKTLKLNTGAEIPTVALGTWQAAPGEVAKAVEAALKAGYRHIDCAWAYGNENEVGEGIKASGVPRSEIFLVSKLWSTFHRNPTKGLQESLDKLGTDYLDLYLMHWPIPLNGENKSHPLVPTRENGARDLDEDWSYIQTWKEMEKLVDTGKVKAIGVSNCSKEYLEELLKQATITPAANQIELHALNSELELVEYCQSKGIVVEAYSPLGSSGSPLMKEDAVLEIAKRNNVEPGTVLLSYLVNRDIVVLPKSVSPTRIASNLNIIDLSKEDIETLNQLGHGDKQKRYCNPPWGVDLKFKGWKVLSTAK